MIEEHNGVKLSDVLEALDREDAKEGRRLLRKMTSPDALPCPCCGGEPEFNEHGDNVEICCVECGMRTPIWEYDKVVEIWNRRVRE